MTDINVGVAPTRLTADELVLADSNTEFAYPLTSFVSANYPRIWAIPDMSNAIPVLCVKIFSNPWVDKMPPGYNMLFLRVSGGRAAPTAFQEAIWSQLEGKFRGEDGKVSPSKLYLVKGAVYDEETAEWRHAVCELTNNGYNQLSKWAESLARETEGMSSVAKWPFNIRREGQRAYEFSFAKNLGRVPEIMEQAKGEEWQPVDYVVTRSNATEAYLAEITEAAAVQAVHASNRAAGGLDEFTNGAVEVDPAKWAEVIDGTDLGVLAAAVQGLCPDAPSSVYDNDDRLREYAYTQQAVLSEHLS